AEIEGGAPLRFKDRVQRGLALAGRQAGQIRLLPDRRSLFADPLLREVVPRAFVECRAEDVIALDDPFKRHAQSRDWRSFDLPGDLAAERRPPELLAPDPSLLEREGEDLTRHQTDLAFLRAASFRRLEPLSSCRRAASRSSSPSSIRRARSLTARPGSASRASRARSNPETMRAAPSSSLPAS